MSRRRTEALVNGIGGALMFAGGLAELVVTADVIGIFVGALLALTGVLYLSMAALAAPEVRRPRRDDEGRAPLVVTYEPGERAVTDEIDRQSRFRRP